MVKHKSKVKTSRLLTKMNIRTIIRSKFQFLAVIFITAIAMTLYVGLTSNAKSINQRVDKLYQGSNVADIWTTTSVNDEKDLHEIERMVGPNGKTESRFVISSRLSKAENSKINATALISDKLPTINKPYETDSTETDDFFIVDDKITVDQTKKSPFIDENGNYKTVAVDFSIAGYNRLFEQKFGFFDGKEVTVREALSTCLVDENNKILNEPYLTLNFKVSGLMKSAENVQSSNMSTTNFLLSKGYFKKQLFSLVSSTFQNPVITSDDDQAELKHFIIDNNIIPMSYLFLNNMMKDNQYVSIVDPSYNIETVKENIQNYFQSKEKTNFLMCTELDMLSSNFTIQSDITQARQLAYIFPIIFFLVAILVVLTTISQIILKDRIEISTLKAMGLSNTKIVMHYMALGVYIVLIGIAIGLVIGPFIIPLIMDKKYDILYTLPAMQFVISWPEALISALGVILVTCLVTFLIARKSVALKPAEGMRPKEVKIAKASKSDAKITKSSIPIRMAFRNIRLNIAKSLMVIVGIAGCTSLLVCGFGIDDTLNNGVNTDTRNFYNADYYVSYTTNDSIKKDVMNCEVKDKIKDYEEYTYLPASAATENQTYNTFLYIIEDNSKFFNLNDYIKTGEVLVSNKVAKQLKLKIGDEISFSSISYHFTGKVGYILDSFYTHGIFVNGGEEVYQDINNVKTAAWMNYQNVEAEKLSNFIDSLSKVGGVGAVRSKKENLDTINSYMMQISSMTLAVKVFAILLAIVVLYNLSLLNFRERIRDIATLKVLGFSRYEIAASLIMESMFLTLIGACIGLGLGLPMEILVLIVNLTPVVEFLYTVFPLSYVISFLLTIGTTMLVNYLLTFKIKGVQMVESLKSVE